MKSSISNQLQSLNEVTRGLVQCQSLEEAVAKALAEVRKHLKVQVASIFLLSKEGVIERVGIDGVDVNNNVIEDSWLSEEHYKPGESFSGLPVPTADSESDYGNPNYVNNIAEYFPNMKYGKEYREKLGKLCRLALLKSKPKSHCLRKSKDLQEHFVFAGSASSIQF